MVQSGKSEKTVVRRLVSDIREFSAEINDQAYKMARETDDLNGYWDDPQYKAFRAYMEGIIDDLVKATSVLNEAADTVEQRELKEI